MRTTRQPETRRGFTLIELIVVVTLIALILAIVLPSLTEAFSSSSEDQARAVMSATLGAARSLAIQYQQYTLVHAQMGRDGRCWGMVFRYQPATGLFKPVPGYPPQPFPTDIAFGQQSQPVVSYYGGINAGKLDTDDQLAKWTNFNVVFNPNGCGVVTFPVAMDTNSDVFYRPGTDPSPNTTGLWDILPAPIPWVAGMTPPEWTRVTYAGVIYRVASSDNFAHVQAPDQWHYGSGPNVAPPYWLYIDAGSAWVIDSGVLGLTIFNYRKVKALSGTDRRGWLNTYALFMGVSPQTGQLLPVK